MEQASAPGHEGPWHRHILAIPLCTYQWVKSLQAWPFDNRSPPANVPEGQHACATGTCTHTTSPHLHFLDEHFFYAFLFAFDPHFTSVGFKHQYVSVDIAVIHSDNPLRPATYTEVTSTSVYMGIMDMSEIRLSCARLTFLS